MGKEFTRSYHIATPDGFILINGDQVTKIGVKREGDNGEVTFFLSDGSSHTIGPNGFTKLFIVELVKGLTKISDLPPSAL